MMTESDKLERAAMVFRPMPTGALMDSDSMCLELPFRRHSVAINRRQPTRLQPHFVETSDPAMCQRAMHRSLPVQVQ